MTSKLRRGNGPFGKNQPGFHEMSKKERNLEHFPSVFFPSSYACEKHRGGKSQVDLTVMQHKYLGRAKVTDVWNFTGFDLWKGPEINEIFFLNE